MAVMGIQKHLITVMLVMLLLTANASCFAQAIPKTVDDIKGSENSHLFLLPYFLGNGETGIYFAYSYDGLKFQWLSDRDLIVPAPKWGDESLTRDPSILYHDGTFHMIWTTSWNSRSIGYTSSEDLRRWTEPKRINIWQDRKDVRNTWAPELH